MGQARFMTEKQDELLGKHEALQEKHEALLEKHEALATDHTALQDAYNKLKLDVEEHDCWEMIEVTWKVDDIQNKLAAGLPVASQSVPVAGFHIGLRLTFEDEWADNRHMGIYFSHCG